MLSSFSEQTTKKIRKKRMVYILCYTCTATNTFLNFKFEHAVSLVLKLYCGHFAAVPRTNCGCTAIVLQLYCGHTAAVPTVQGLNYACAAALLQAFCGRAAAILGSCYSLTAVVLQPYCARTAAVPRSVLQSYCTHTAFKLHYDGVRTAETLQS